MADTVSQGLAATLVAARHRERSLPRSTTAPALFTLDRRLKIPGEFGYRINAGKIGF